MKSETYNSTDRRFGERFRTVIERIGTLEKAGALVGTSGEQVGKWRDEKAKAPFLAISILAAAAGVTADWLARGVEPTAPMSQSMMLPSVDDDPDVAMIAKLDVIASAGPGFENPYPYELDRLPFPRQWLDWLGVPEEAARFLDSRGDSMWPTIPEGAICLADIRHQRPRLDGVYVLLDGDNVRIKRIGRGFEGRIELISDNEKYPNETLAGPEAEALRVAGKVVWAGGKI